MNDAEIIKGYAKNNIKVQNKCVQAQTDIVYSNHELNKHTLKEIET